jgi:hypothetical protein
MENEMNREERARIEALVQAVELAKTNFVPVHDIVANAEKFYKFLVVVN